MMNSTKPLNIFYIDDEKDDLILPIKTKLESEGKLNLNWIRPNGFEADIEILQEELRKFDGILLDLQLDEIQVSGVQVKYQAPPLAQQLRTLASEEKIPDLPIILCSTADKIKVSYNRDFTSHNLFDWTFLKKDIDHQTINKISTIIQAYKSISKNRKDFSMLLDRDYKEIDERILSRFINEPNPPVHEISRTIFKEIVQSPGVLISESILAARLGVDMMKSPDWEELKVTIFSDALYSGVFSEGWNRWWADKVSDTFEELTGENLAGLLASERVGHLKKLMRKEDLVEAEPINFCNSSNFWTICEVLGRPLDPFEGYKIDMKEEPRGWQDYTYVSLLALLERKAEEKDIKIHPSETQRYEIESAKY